MVTEVLRHILEFVKVNVCFDYLLNITYKFYYAKKSQKV